MKNKIKLSACAIGLLTAIQMIAVPGANANPQTCKSYGPPNNAYYKWKAVWGDEFNSNWLNTNTWYPYEREDNQPDPDGAINANGQKIFHTNGWFSPDNVTVGGGFLEIQSRTNGTNAPKGKKYSGGWIQSRDKFNKGYFEACVKVQWNDDRAPTWSTFWLWEKKSDGSANEFDIMEWVGNHWPKYPTQSHHGPRKQFKFTTQDNPPAQSSLHTRQAQSWHTWGMLWKNDEITFYLDGVKQFSSHRPGAANWDYLPIIFSSSPVQKKLLPGYESPQLPRFIVDFVRVYHSPLIDNSIR
ncbi:MAG: family 16 glycosylhydrolase, partial [Granulosicoccus sp.]